MQHKYILVIYNAIYFLFFLSVTQSSIKQRDYNEWGRKDTSGKKGTRVLYLHPPKAYKK